MSADPALLSLARSAALLGGRMARDAFRGNTAVMLKPDQSEVTETDIAIQRAIVAHVHASRPDDSVIGEEDAGARVESVSAPVVWVIDPIDGTRNFIRGVPLFTTSVAALENGTPVAAAIYDPIADTLYTAAAGAGANVEQPHPAASNVERPPSAAGTVERPTLAASPLRFGPQSAVRNPAPIIAVPSAWRRERSDFTRRLIEACVIRSLGCATLHLTLTATGGVDGTYLNNCKLWDIAAGWLIVKEAGGVITGANGEPLFPIDPSSYRGEEMPTLAGRPETHAWLLSLTVGCVATPPTAKRR